MRALQSQTSPYGWRLVASSYCSPFTRFGQTLHNSAALSIVSAMFLWTTYALLAAASSAPNKLVRVPQHTAAIGSKRMDSRRGRRFVRRPGSRDSGFNSGVGTELRIGPRHGPASSNDASGRRARRPLACFALFLGKLGNFFGDARLSQQGTFCAVFQAVVLAWGIVAIYAIGTSADPMANIMRSAVTAMLVGGDAIWLGLVTRRARLPLKSL